MMIHAVLCCVVLPQSVSLTESDILRIRDVFDAIAAGRDTEQGLRIEDIFFYVVSQVGTRTCTLSF